jgi:hypothetical protein
MTMLDTTSIATDRPADRGGLPEGELIVRVKRSFPDLTWPELSQALQAAAERQLCARIEEVKLRCVVLR